MSKVAVSPSLRLLMAFHCVPQSESLSYTVSFALQNLEKHSFQNPVIAFQSIVQAERETEKEPWYRRSKGQWEPEGSIDDLEPFKVVQLEKGATLYPGTSMTVLTNHTVHSTDTLLYPEFVNFHVYVYADGYQGFTECVITEEVLETMKQPFDLRREYVHIASFDLLANEYPFQVEP